MIDLGLINYMREELANTPTAFRRYAYNRVIWSDRMFGITGPRGVGKSTMVKQHLISQENQSDWLYVSADHIYFSAHSLYDLAQSFVLEGGHHLIIDEIHKLIGWSRDLKMIYDTFPGLQIIFTGSSILDIHKGTSDLSRRVLIFEMQGLSFREFLELHKGITIKPYSLDEILSHKVTLPPEVHPLPLLREYMEKGYYPFSHLPGYDIRLQQIVTQTVEVDIPQFCNMNAMTARKLKRMLSIVAGSAPVKPSIQHLATELNISKNDVPDYLLYLEMAGMLGQVRNDTGGFRGLGKVDKIYVDNPNLMFALGNGSPNIGNLRETFFYNQMRVNNDVMTSKKTDFIIGDFSFEIGGAKKGSSQLGGDPKGFVVRDDIEYGFSSFLPLWVFGLNY
ncbi:MAG: AAA family ATPase [Muribaculaceae bacterium]|nr:AAA family ATPase [Muribaculaceae bacterium]